MTREEKIEKEKLFLAEMICYLTFAFCRSKFKPVDGHEHMLFISFNQQAEVFVKKHMKTDWDSENWGATAEKFCGDTLAWMAENKLIV